MILLIKDKPIPLSLHFTCNAPETVACDGVCFRTYGIRAIHPKEGFTKICPHLMLKGSINVDLNEATQLKKPIPEHHNDSADISYKKPTGM